MGAIKGAQTLKKLKTVADPQNERSPMFGMKGTGSFKEEAENNKKSDLKESLSKMNTRSLNYEPEEMEKYVGVPVYKLPPSHKMK